jgi:hypothetical protein
VVRLLEHPVSETRSLEAHPVGLVGSPLECVVADCADRHVTLSRPAGPIMDSALGSCSSLTDPSEPGSISSG